MTIFYQKHVKRSKNTHYPNDNLYVLSVLNREQRYMLLLRIFFITLLFFASLYSMLFAGEADRQRVRALADQGLFAVAEQFCDDQFQQENVRDADKFLLAAELARSYTLHLLSLEPSQRPQMFRNFELLESRLRIAHNTAHSPDVLLAKIIFRLQIAMAFQSLGDDQRLDADTASITNRQAAYQQARNTLENALDRLKQCRQELLSLRQRADFNTDASFNQRLQALEYSITMQQGITQKSLALTFPSEDDRKFALRQAAETLSSLASLDSVEPIVVQCKIEQASIHRLAGELDRSAGILNQLNSVSQTLTAGCRLRLETEWIRYQIAAGNITDIRRHYATDRDNVHLYPEFDIARLELFLASDLLRGIRAEPMAALRLEQSIDRQFGPHWARRARRVVLASGNSELNSAEMLQTRGDQHYREGQFHDAAILYEQASAQSDARRHADSMFRYNRLAAHTWMKAIEHLPSDEPKTDYQRRVVALLERLNTQEPNHPEAFELYTLALNLQCQIAMSLPDTLDEYLALLNGYTKRWADHTAASSPLFGARRLAVILLERQGRIDEASAMLPLLDEEHLTTLPAEIQRLRVRQLDAEGKTQDAVDMLIAMLNQRRDSATLQMFADILTRQSDSASLHHALKSWLEIETLADRNSELWWSAREGILIVLMKLNKPDEASQSFAMLRILYPNLGGAERKERLEKMFE